MEHISKLLNQAYQGTDQPGPSPTLRKENRVCSCGNAFTAYIKVVSGKDVVDGEKSCPSCHYKANEEAEVARRLALLPEIREAQRDIWWEDYNLPAKFALKTFESFDKKLQPEAYDALINYNYEWDDTTNLATAPKSLVLFSPDLYGVGKTHLVAALFNRIVEAGETLSVRKDGNYRKLPCPVYFIAENTLISRIRQTFSKRNQHNDDESFEETEEDVYRRLAKVSLLVIDDVGKVRPRDYSFLQGVYFRVINDRYEDEMPLILTANLSLTELEHHIGGACSDRLVEMAGKNGFIKMTGKSYRSSRPPAKSRRAG